MPPPFPPAGAMYVHMMQVAGNYAADMLPNMLAKKAGYPIALYLDAKTNSLVEVGARVGLGRVRIG